LLLFESTRCLCLLGASDDLINQSKPLWALDDRPLKELSTVHCYFNCYFISLMLRCFLSKFIETLWSDGSSWNIVQIYTLKDGNPERSSSTEYSRSYRSAGVARPAPPVGPALGFYRLNLMAFCKDFNARTQKYKAETPMQVNITALRIAHSSLLSSMYSPNSMQLSSKIKDG
jgi:hypothetical protein